MAMVEVVEHLRQLEGMLGQVRRLAGRDALLYYQRRFGSRQPQLPDFVARLAAQVLRQIVAGRYVLREVLRFESAFAKNVTGANHGVLCVRPGLTLEAERVLEIERDHGLLSELEHEIAQRADRDLPRNRRALVFAQLRM